MRGQRGQREWARGQQEWTEGTEGRGAVEMGRGDRGSGQNGLQEWTEGTAGIGRGDSSSGCSVTESHQSLPCFEGEGVSVIGNKRDPELCTACCYGLEYIISEK